MNLLQSIAAKYDFHLDEVVEGVLATFPRYMEKAFVERHDLVDCEEEFSYRAPFSSYPMLILHIDEMLARAETSKLTVSEFISVMLVALANMYEECKNIRFYANFMARELYDKVEYSVFFQIFMDEDSHVISFNNMLIRYDYIKYLSDKIISKSIQFLRSINFNIPVFHPDSLLFGAAVATISEDCLNRVANSEIAIYYLALTQLVRTQSQYAPSEDEINKSLASEELTEVKCACDKLHEEFDRLSADDYMRYLVYWKDLRSSASSDLTGSEATLSIMGRIQDDVDYSLSEGASLDQENLYSVEGSCDQLQKKSALAEREQVNSDSYSVRIFASPRSFLSPSGSEESLCDNFLNWARVEAPSSPV